MEANIPAAGVSEAVIAAQSMVKGMVRRGQPSEEEASKVNIDFYSLLQQDALTAEMQAQEALTELMIEETSSDAEKEKTGAEALTVTPAHITLPELEIPLSEEEQRLVGDDRSIVGKKQKNAANGGVVLKSPEETQVLTNDVNTLLRRKNIGQVLYDDKFPNGWEVLLKDNTAHKPALPIKAKEAIWQQFELSGKAIQPGLENQLSAKESALPKEGWLQLDSNTPGKQAVLISDTEPETITMPVKKIEFASSSHEFSQQTIRADSNSENMKTNSVNAVKSSAPSAGQIMLKMNEAQKHMFVETIVQTTVKGINAKQEQLIMELQPPELGRIKIVVQNSGEQVNTHLTIQDPRVGEFLQERIEAIRKSMEEAGIRLGDLKLEIKQEFNLQSKEENSDQNGAKKQKSIPLEHENKTGATATQPKMRWSHSGKVNMVI